MELGLLLITAVLTAMIGYCGQPPTAAPSVAEEQTVCGACGPEPATGVGRFEPGSSTSSNASVMLGETLVLSRRLVIFVPRVTVTLAVGSGWPIWKKIWLPPVQVTKISPIWSLTLSARTAGEAAIPTEQVRGVTTWAFARPGSITAAARKETN